MDLCLPRTRILMFQNQLHIGIQDFRSIISIALCIDDHEIIHNRQLRKYDVQESYRIQI